MPFCESCGSEIGPGKKFCTECGAPVAGAAFSPPPPPAAPVPASPSPPLSRPAENRKLPIDKVIIAVIMVTAIAGIVMFVGLPFLQAQGTGGSAPAGGKGTPVTLPSNTVVTPLPAATTLPSGSATAASSGTTVYRSGVAYTRVYLQRFEVGSAHGTFSYTLKDPPLVVECDMNPQMVTREKLVDIGTASERYLTLRYADPSAWLDLKIINADTDQVVDMIRFSKNYEGTLQQAYTIRAPGNYRFQLDGSLVSPEVRLLLKQ